MPLVNENRLLTDCYVWKVDVLMTKIAVSGVFQNVDREIAFTLKVLESPLLGVISKNELIVRRSVVLVNFVSHKKCVAKFRHSNLNNAEF